MTRDVQHLGAGIIAPDTNKVSVYRWTFRGNKWRIYCPCCDYYRSVRHWDLAYALAYAHALTLHGEGAHDG